jgi:hypothetical protein
MELHGFAHTDAQPDCVRFAVWNGYWNTVRIRNWNWVRLLDGDGYSDTVAYGVG